MSTVFILTADSFLTATVTTVIFISIFWSPYILDYLFMSPAQIKTPSIFDFD